MKFLKKSSPETKVFLLFFSLLLLFTFARGPIGAFNAALLALTGETTARRSDNGKDGSYVQKSGSKSRRKKSKRKKFSDKPTTTNLPKTKRPVVAWCDTLSISAAHAPEFPPLRRFDGKKWSGDKTVIRAVTNGTKIKIRFHLFDAKPNEAVTSNSRRDPSLAWEDDAIEFFLMKDRDATIYAQYVLSVIGRGDVYLMKCSKNNLASGTRISTPSDFILPTMSGKRTSDGFLLEMTISLSNIGMGSLEPGGKLLMQIVRDYRGRGSKESMILQLFPTYIYADNRRGANNHHRKAFMPVKIVDSNDLKNKSLDETN